MNRPANQKVNGSSPTTTKYLFVFSFENCEYFSPLCFYIYTHQWTHTTGQQWEHASGTVGSPILARALGVQLGDSACLVHSALSSWPVDSQIRSGNLLTTWFFYRWAPEKPQFNPGVHKMKVKKWLWIKTSVNENKNVYCSLTLNFIYLLFHQQTPKQTSQQSSLSPYNITAW